MCSAAIRKEKLVIPCGGYYQRQLVNILALIFGLSETEKTSCYSAINHDVK